MIWAALFDNVVDAVLEVVYPVVVLIRTFEEPEVVERVIVGG